MQLMKAIPTGAVDDGRYAVTITQNVGNADITPTNASESANSDNGRLP